MTDEERMRKALDTLSTVGETLQDLSHKSQITSFDVGILFEIARVIRDAAIVLQRKGADAAITAHQHRYDNPA